MLVRGARWSIYGLTVVLGLATAFYPAPPIAGVIGLHFTYLYGALLLLGGIMALWGDIKPTYRVELTGLWLAAGGWSLYALALWGLYVNRIIHPTDQPASYGAAIGVTVAALFFFKKVHYLSVKSRAILKLKALDDDRLA
jgi:hypothetical protein